MQDIPQPLIQRAPRTKPYPRPVGNDGQVWFAGASGDTHSPSEDGIVLSEPLTLELLMFPPVLRTAVIVAATTSQLVACSCSESSPVDAARTDDATTDLGECVPYTGAEISGTSSGSFASADEIVKIALPVTDVGGGLLRVTYQAHNQPMVGSIWLGEGARSDEARHVTAAFGPGVADSTAVVYYRLAGNKRYEIGVQSYSFDDSGEDDYTITYAYEPQPDCYEANDTRSAARRIPLDTTITASLHAGIGTEDGDIVSATGEDWYTFELTAPKVVQLRGFLPGKEGADGVNSAMLTIFTADGTTAADCGGGEGSFETDPVSPTESVETCEGTLAAGTYYVRLGYFVSQYAVTGNNEAPHRSWNTPYTFIVSAR